MANTKRESQTPTYRRCYRSVSVPTRGLSLQSSPGREKRKVVRSLRCSARLKRNTISLQRFLLPTPTTSDTLSVLPLELEVYWGLSRADRLMVLYSSCTHTHTHTHTHTYAHTHKHTHTHAPTHTRMHTPPTHGRTYARTYAHTNIFKR